LPYSFISEIPALSETEVLTIAHKNGQESGGEPVIDTFTLTMSSTVSFYYNTITGKITQNTDKFKMRLYKNYGTAS